MDRRSFLKLQVLLSNSTDVYVLEHSLREVSDHKDEAKKPNPVRCAA